MKRRDLVALSALALTGCAPVIQAAGAPGLDFAGPRLEPDAFVSFDGARLGLTVWPTHGEPWAVIIGLHGMNDYANAFHLAAPVWAAQGIAVYAYDQRGFGRSPQRGVWAGQALAEEDLRTFAAVLRARHPHAILAIAGESMGGAVAIAALASERPPDVDRVVLLAPAVWGWSSQPLPYAAALWLTAHTIPRVVLEPPSFVTSTIRASDNTPELIAMGRDPLMIWGARTDALYGLVQLMQTAWRDTGKIALPTAYLYGAHDQIIPRKPTTQAAHRLRPGDRTAYYADGWHLLLRDLHAAAIYADVAAFIRDPAAPLPSGAPPIPASLPPLKDD
jgi:alpha-beta hydrolase superfamily lysophospholipase